MFCSHWGKVRTEHSNNLPYNFGIHKIAKPFVRNEAIGMGMHDNQIALPGAICEQMRSISPQHQLERLFPKRFAAKGRRRGFPAVYGDKERTGESRVQCF
jgi:hypothetical protein